MLVMRRQSLEMMKHSNPSEGMGHFLKRVWESTVGGRDFGAFNNGRPVRDAHLTSRGDAEPPHYGDEYSSLLLGRRELHDTNVPSVPSVPSLPSNQYNSRWANGAEQRRKAGRLKEASGEENRLTREHSH